MQYRMLGKTDLKVSVVGMGGFGIGGGYLMKDGATAIRAIERAIERGITYFDTAPFAYNDSELLLGRALKGRRDKVVLASKAENLDRHSVRDCVETSLRQMQTDYLDLVQLRDPSPENLASSRFEETCAALIAEGKLRFAATTVGDTHLVPQAMLSMDRQFPVVQLAYNLIFSRAATDVLPRALAENTGIVVRGPLCKGFLADRLTARPDDVRSHPNFSWFTPEEGDALLQIQRELGFLVIEGRRSLAQAALQFAVRHPAISVAIPGLETPEDVDQLVAALDAPALTDAEVERALAIVAQAPAIDY
jgi:aryl-alcohol dehydrogenase (NADP+)